MRPRLPSLIVAACFALPAFAQPSPAPGRIPTVTRLVKQFSELEMALVASAHATDAAALEAMLDSAFEMRVGGAPGTPVPRDDWMREMRATPRAAPRIDQMAVHALGDIAIVSFREVSVAQRKGRASTRFVIDRWKRDGDAWKLAVRYRSDVRGGGDAKPSAGTIDKRY